MLSPPQQPGTEQLTAMLAQRAPNTMPQLARPVELGSAYSDFACGTATSSEPLCCDEGLHIDSGLAGPGPSLATVRQERSSFEELGIRVLVSRA